MDGYGERKVMTVATTKKYKRFRRFSIRFTAVRNVLYDCCGGDDVHAIFSRKLPEGGGVQRLTLLDLKDLQYSQSENIVDGNSEKYNPIFDEQRRRKNPFFIAFRRHIETDSARKIHNAFVCMRGNVREGWLGERKLR